MTIQPELATVSFAADLARFGDRTAVYVDGGSLSYRVLADRVDAVARSLGTVRRLVALEADNCLPSLVAYLAALAAGHPLLILPPGKIEAIEALIAAYDPDVVVRSVGDRQGLEVRRDGTRHQLHPELALLLSTSGSTGSPKLVRLSADGIHANANAIAQYLNLRPDDTAATTLPLSYCYGMSVVNSHLAVGASIVLTDTSVVDPCFWELLREHKVTSFAAVPYTFDLLERVGFPEMDLPSLRYITQAGGRLDPDKVRAYSNLGLKRGWDLFVMYGQTEATARMAYLPPDLAAANPGFIGVPIPGGSFRLEPVPGLEHSELVYTGPNVMLGYAETHEDLNLGRVVDELHTGDLARRTPGGLYEIVGRRSRFVKVVGLRLDLGQVERLLAGMGVPAAAAGTDDGIVAAIEGEFDLPLLAKTLAQDLGIPRGAVRLLGVEQIPRLDNGKPDYPAVLALGTDLESTAAGVRETAALDAGGVVDTVRLAFADALEREDIADNDTFVSLGGDSLSYVAASVRLEQILGTLPGGWHLMPVKELSLLATDPAEPRGGSAASWPARMLRRLVPPLETGILLRALAIIFIVSTHVGLFSWQGTAHVLMGLAGYNFARFQLAGTRRARFRRQLRTVARIIVPSVVVIWIAFAVSDTYSWANVFLLNAILGPPGWSDYSRFWFVEVLVYILLGLAALLAIPAVDRAWRRWPWLFPLVIAGMDLLVRFRVVDLPFPGQGPVLWIFALGWAAAASRRWWHRAAVSAVAVLAVPGLFENDVRNDTLLAGLLVLIWIPAIPVPRFLHRIAAVLAGASLYIYVSHWLVYPLVDQISKALAVAASLLVGIAYAAVATKVMNLAERRCRIWRSTRTATGS
ncbi:AMP-binding protein [Paeniglutamicibacter sp.]|uniref:AMP-binding protein n=1 Tax=Paeniglutamicibacter sp. TaxID=1934391 RepID=UPI003989ED8C